MRALTVRPGVAGSSALSELPEPASTRALNREWVLENDVVFGSVNANRRHYALGAAALAAADPAWLEALLTRRVPWDRYAEALEARDGDVKTVLVL